MSNLADAQRQAGLESGPTKETGLVGVLRLIDRVFAKLEEVIVAACLATLLVVGVFLAIKRHYFPPSPYWADEVIRYMVFYTGMFGAALAAQSERLFNIDMFTRSFGARGKMVIRMVTGAFTIAVCWYTVQGALVMRTIGLEGEKGEIVSPATGAIALPVALGLIAVHMALHIVIDIVYLATGRIAPEFAGPQAPPAH